MPTVTRLAHLLRRLTTLQPRSRKVVDVKMELEPLLRRAAVERGLRATARTIAALNARGRRLVLVDRGPSRRRWREELAGGRRTLEISVFAHRMFHSVNVQYQSVRTIRLTPRQRRIHALQQAFYARYMAVGQQAYGDPRSRVAPDDRLLLLVGELEADVNNGGFSQYLDNKGQRRARAALAALQAIGARKTARMLEQAMAPGTTPDRRSALDDRFYQAPEDLAVLAARRVGLRVHTAGPPASRSASSRERRP